MTQREIVLAAHNLKVSKSGTEIVSISELTIGRGEFIAVAGPNGAGKSTLLKTLAFLEQPSAGEIYFRGGLVRGRGNVLAARRRMAVVFQDPLLLRGTVLANVAVGLKLRGFPGDIVLTRAWQWLERMNIAHLAARDVRTLSGGEARRVSLARAMVLEPDVLFMDEPFTHLDTPGKSALVSELQQILADTHTAALMVTHDLTDALCLADRLIVMMNGRVRQDGPVEQVLLHPVSREVAEFVGVENIWHGCLRPAADETMIFEADGGVASLTVACRAGGYKPVRPGGPVTACIRPEHVQVFAEDDNPPEPGPEVNVFKGRVTAVYAVGYHYRLKVMAGIEISALAGAFGHVTPPKPGDQVTLMLPPERINLIC